MQFKNITFEDVRVAISRIRPVPTSMEEREQRLNEELKRQCGQIEAFYNESGSEAYSPRRRRDQWVATGV